MILAISVLPDGATDLSQAVENVSFMVNPERIYSEHGEFERRFLLPAINSLFRDYVWTHDVGTFGTDGRRQRVSSYRRVGRRWLAE